MGDFLSKGVLSNDFNNKIKRVGIDLTHNVAQVANVGNRLNDNLDHLNGNIAQLGNKAIDEASLSVNKLNDNVANLGNQMNYNVANIGNRLNDNLDHLNGNIAQLGNKAIDEASLSVNKLNDNVANLGNQMNYNVANIGNRLNENFGDLNGNIAQLGNKAIDEASLSVNKLNDNVSNIGNRLNDNVENIGTRVAHLGEELKNDVSWFSENVVDSMNSLFFYIKILLIVLTIILAIVIIRYAILWIYRCVRKIRKDCSNKEKHKDKQNLHENFKLTAKLNDIETGDPMEVSVVQTPKMSGSVLVLLSYAILRINPYFQKIQIDISNKQNNGQLELPKDDPPKYDDVQQITCIPIETDDTAEVSVVKPRRISVSTTIDIDEPGEGKSSEYRNQGGFFLSRENQSSWAALFGSKKSHKNSEFLPVPSLTEKLETETVTKPLLYCENETI